MRQIEGAPEGVQRLDLGIVPQALSTPERVGTALHLAMGNVATQEIGKPLIIVRVKGDKHTAWTPLNGENNGSLARLSVSNGDNGPAIGFRPQQGDDLFRIGVDGTWQQGEEPIDTLGDLLELPYDHPEKPTAVNLLRIASRVLQRSAALGPGQPPSS